MAENRFPLGRRKWRKSALSRAGKEQRKCQDPMSPGRHFQRFPERKFREWRNRAVLGE